MNRITLGVVLIILLMSTESRSQCENVHKDFTKPVLMHYMPWFDTPEFQGRWGWHWRMNTQDPDSIDMTTGRRQIASHFYPLIGPYASIDPDVIEYHLLALQQTSSYLLITLHLL